VAYFVGVARISKDKGLDRISSDARLHECPALLFSE
jgi:hypothetical protein